MIRRLIFAVGLVAGVAGFWTQPAHAIIGPCNNCADSPVFAGDGSGTGMYATISVSDGTTVYAGVRVADTTSDIEGLAYVVHIPSDATVTGYQFTGSESVSKSLAVEADQPDGRYATDALVTDGTDVAVQTALVAQNDAGCGSGQQSGVADTTITAATALTGSC